MTVALHRRLEDSLGPQGFSRSGQRWYRRVGHLTDVVAVIKSKAGLSLDTEVGVFDPVPHQLLWGELPSTITEAHCTVRILIDDLAEVRTVSKDLDSDVQALAARTAALGLPWLESMHDLQARVEYLRRRAWLTSVERVILALSELAAGDGVRARQRLAAEAESGPPSWRRQIRALQGRPNLPSA